MKDIVCFDVETTGLNPKTDFIIQMSLIKLDSKTLNVKDKKYWFIIPDQPFEISETAESIHHISKEMLLDSGVRMKSVAPEIIEFFKDCDILTYNGNTFDIKFLIKDLALAGYTLQLSGVHFYDAYAMETKLSPRNLSAVYKKYMGKEMINAHDSFQDAMATVDIFKKQLKNNELNRKDINEWPENQLYSTNGSIKNTGDSKKEILVFTRGKYKDSDFMDVCKKDPQYIKWFITETCDMYTRNRLQEYYNSHKSKKKSKK